MNIFFETLDSALTNRSKYLAVYNIPDTTELICNSRLFSILFCSSRAWLEKDSGVEYIKNRFEDISTAVVDPKEFCWIKLKSIEFTSTS